MVKINSYNNEMSMIETINKKRDFSLGKVLLYILENTLEQEFFYVMEDDLHEFVKQNEQKILDLYERYKYDEHSNPLIWQPTLYLILHQLETNSFKLAEEWKKELSIDMLVSISEDWGVPFPYTIGD